MDKLSFLSANDPEIIESLYRTWLESPEEVEPGWRNFFDGFNLARSNYSDEEAVLMPKEFNVINLITAYRQRGHLFTLTNPVRTRRKYSPTLDIDNFGLTEADLDKTFEAGKTIGLGVVRLSAIIDHLKTTYCRSVGVEFFHIRNPEMVEWLRERMESSRNMPVFTVEQKHRILNKLSEAVLFEKFIHKKFPGQKRFSLEGAETLIPALDAVIEIGSELGSEEFVIGMSHRGRLNVLANILGKSTRDIFTEFQGLEYDDELLLGDVKYHLGYTTDIISRGGKKVRLTLSPNPSHLETVNPVVEGIVRARLDSRYRGNQQSITPILIHGDAAIAGQGIVYEVVQMSELAGFKTGGTVHIVVNNQVGFTTNYLDSRTSVYCTDVAKVIQSPVFHVNGDDVEAVVYTMKLAMEFRERWHRNVFVDLLCYRKYGHNESDEPRFTQPTLYKIIENHPNPRDIYARELMSTQQLTKELLAQGEEAINSHLEICLSKSREADKAQITNFLAEDWKDIRRAIPDDFARSPDTAVSLDTLQRITKAITFLPTGKQFFKKIEKLMSDRADSVFKTGKIDWGMAELLAYATLADEGHPIRLTGQDVERGTFSHRHAVLTMDETDEKYNVLSGISKGQGAVHIYNSSLSEYGVLGFEYGYALAQPDTLTIWEAQFGDFSNGAQIILDQFISSAEDKWNVMNGLVMLLPHGYEGQGPEHSSARLERYLTLCAEFNFQVANCTTPANFFHLLRRQLHRDFRKPLVVFTPKSLLRHPDCVSAPDDFTFGGFREVIDDDTIEVSKVTRVVMCSGKVYYDLLAEKRRSGREDIALVRLEQIHPLPKEQLLSIKNRYNSEVRWLWVQEEPANMGAWSFLRLNLQEIDLKLISRPASGSPATGSSKFHFVQQKKIVDKAFHQCQCPRLDIECRMVCIGNQWKSIEKTLEIEKQK
ncbi:MAG: 2-oxoglutarate dehydrogenase E1 component [Bacteroidetes bacterium HGW-Bacteroidetes-22]|nr:MAG: 2-oxoglutarate dehydrogenase E1 component [Bacteroidetes bacterium HGW-Bacteroidetes-22]